MSLVWFWRNSHSFGGMKNHHLHPLATILSSGPDSPLGDNCGRTRREQHPQSHAQQCARRRSRFERERENASGGETESSINFYGVFVKTCAVFFFFFLVFGCFFLLLLLLLVFFFFSLVRNCGVVLFCRGETLVRWCL